MVLSRHMQWTRDKMSSSVSEIDRLSSAYVLSGMGVIDKNIDGKQTTRASESVAKLSVGNHTHIFIC